MEKGQFVTFIKFYYKLKIKCKHKIVLKDIKNTVELDTNNSYSIAFSFTCDDFILKIYISKLRFYFNYIHV